jgi:hypothetical protein
VKDLWKKNWLGNSSRAQNETQDSPSTLGDADFRKSPMKIDL